MKKQGYSILNSQVPSASALPRNEDQFVHHFLDAVREPLLLLDRNLSVHAANRSFYKMFRLTGEEITGKPVFDLPGGQWDIAAFKHLLEDTWLNHTGYQDFELKLDPDQTGHRSFFLNISKLHGDGQPERILLALEDMTQHNTNWQFKNALIGMAGHELKTPVTSIKAYAQMLHIQATKLKDQFFAGALDKISTQADKLTDLINLLLDITRIQSGKLKLETENVNLDDLVREILESLKPGNITHPVSIKGNVASPVIADRTRIAQVIATLTNNAFRHSPEKGRVAITLTQDKGNAVISVRDSGPGIPEEKREGLFDAIAPEYDNKKEKIQGMGLGLYIAAGIIREHGGRIWYDCNSKTGSVFSFSLPFLK